MARFGLVGPSYSLESPSVDAERTVNWYPTTVEALGKSPQWLAPTPGLSVFCTLAGVPRGTFPFDFQGSSAGTLGFAVGGVNLYQIFANGTATVLGNVGNDGNPAYLAANQEDQLCVASAGQIYVYNVVMAAFLGASAGLLAPVVKVVYCEGYFVALLNDGRIQVSAPEDGTTWPSLQVIIPTAYADRTIGMEVLHQEIWFWSSTHAQAYYASGSTNIFDPIGRNAAPDAGLGAIYATVFADTTLFWLESSSRGNCIARSASGYVPTRVSNHAVEYHWSTYPTVSDAIGYSYLDQGHTWVVFYFPSARGGLGATWCLDVESGYWHEREWWDPVNGVPNAHRSRCHMFCFGQHLVGDWASGNIYSMSINTYQDFGGVIRRERVSPPISNENEWVYHNRIQIDLEVGLGPMPPLLDAEGNPRGPQIMLDWSDTFGQTYGTQYFLDCGQAGQFKTRAYKNMLGRSRMRQYRIQATDPIPWRITDGDLIAAPGFTPSERIPKQYAKVS